MSATPPIRVTLSALDDATEWLNSEPLTAAALEGKVVAVQFGTYSCINWIRTLPYVRAWVRAYADDGLVIVGAQTPEFAFEHDIEGVRRSIAQMGLEHPIVLDNDYAIWRSLNNHYWPALYLLDGDGRLRYEHFGEGAYSETEEAFRELVGAEGERVRVEATGVEAAADWDTLRSPETYVGYAQAERRARKSAEELSLNEWALSGTWNDQEEAAELEAAPGSIAYRFQARDVNLVLTPTARRCRSPCSSTGSRPAMRTASTSTRRAAARSPSRGSTSSSASPARCASAPSRSRSTSPASGRTFSHLASAPERRNPGVLGPLLSADGHPPWAGVPGPSRRAQAARSAARRRARRQERCPRHPR